MRSVLILLALTVSLDAAVVLTRDGDRIQIAIDGQPLSDSCFGPDAPKPYYYPVRTKGRPAHELRRRPHDGSDLGQTRQLGRLLGGSRRRESRSRSFRASGKLPSPIALARPRLRTARRQSIRRECVRQSTPSAEF